MENFSGGGTDTDGSDTLNVACSPSRIEADQIGTYPVTYTLSSTDAYGQKVTKDFTEKIIVKDEQAPEIQMSSDSFSVVSGTDFDINTVVSDVSDPVDGALQRVDAAPEKKKAERGPVYEQGWYTVTSDLDCSTAGNYTVSVHAEDRNGNGSDRSVPVEVQESDVSESQGSEAAAASVSDAGTSSVSSPGDTGNAALNSLCDSVLSSVINDGMDDYARCYAIYTWVENNIYYSGGSDHSDWVSGAITALSTRRGDCFAYFSSGMALLTRAGFSCREVNMNGWHYWVQVLYNGQWLNWDATTGWGTERFLWTDDQMRAYSYYNASYGTTISYAGLGF